MQTYCQKYALNTNHTLHYTFHTVLTQLQHLQHFASTNAVTRIELHKNRITLSKSCFMAPVSGNHLKSFTFSCYQHRTIKPAPLDAELNQFILSSMSISACP